MNAPKGLVCVALVCGSVMACAAPTEDDDARESAESTSSALGTPIKVTSFQIMNGLGRALNGWNAVNFNDQGYHRLQETSTPSGVHLSGRYNFDIPYDVGAGYQLKIVGLVPYHTPEKFVVSYSLGLNGPKISIPNGGCEFDQASGRKTCTANIYVFKQTSVHIWVDDDPAQPTDSARDDLWIDYVVLTPLQ